MISLKWGSSLPSKLPLQGYPMHHMSFAPAAHGGSPLPAPPIMICYSMIKKSRMVLNFSPTFLSDFWSFFGFRNQTIGILRRDLGSETFGVFLVYFLFMNLVSHSFWFCHIIAHATQSMSLCTLIKHHTIKKHP